MSSLLLLNQEVRLAFRNCAHQHKQNSYLQRAVSQQLQTQTWPEITKPTHPIPHTRCSRHYATSQPTGLRPRRLPDIGSHAQRKDIQSRTKRPSNLPPPKEHEPPRKQKTFSDFIYDTMLPHVTVQKVNPRLLIYHARTGRIAMVGCLTVAAYLGFLVTIFFIAPAYAVNGEWFTSAALLVCGTMPLVFVRYSTAPLVTWAHLPLPSLAQRSREAALAYAKELPSTAPIHLAYLRYGLFVRRAEVYVGNLVPASSQLKMLTFKTIDTPSRRWLKQPSEFYVSPRSGTGKASKNVVPGVWEHVYERMTQGREISRWRS